MEELILNDQAVLFDREATASVYRSIDQGDADRCNCGGCKNFRQFRSQAYGTELLLLLERLGIDPLKEWEAYSCGVEINGHIEYGGWFVFVGEWSAKNLAKGSGSPTEYTEFFFTDSFPNATKRFGPKALAVEFSIAIPKAKDYISDWD